MSLIAALLLLASHAAPTTGTACPARVAGQRLTDGQVYDGPVPENALLKPDWTRRRDGVEVTGWPIAGTYEAGRHVFLRCAYAARPPVIVEVTRRVTLCRYRDAGRMQSLGCR